MIDLLSDCSFVRPFVNNLEIIKKQIKHMLEFPSFKGPSYKLSSHWEFHESLGCAGNATAAAAAAAAALH